MAKRVSGQIVAVGQARIRRGGLIQVDLITVHQADGTEVTWPKVIVEREVLNLLCVGDSVHLYCSKRWDAVFGIRGPRGSAFGREASRWSLLWSIVMVLAGFGMGVFVLPLLLILAGTLGIFRWRDARRARAMFRRDETYSGSTPGSLTQVRSVNLPSLARSGNNSECPCFSPDARYDQFREWRRLALDMTKGRFAEVTIAECVACGRLWLRYFTEHEAFTRTGRWARGLIDPETARSIRSEEATSFLANLPEYVRGGSYFGTAEVASGEIGWDVI